MNAGFCCSLFPTEFGGRGGGGVSDFGHSNRCVVAALVLIFIKLKIVLSWLVWLSWLKHHPIHQKVVGLIPGQGSYKRQPIDVSHVSVSLSLSLSLISTPLLLSLKAMKNVFR